VGWTGLFVFLLHISRFLTADEDLVAPDQFLFKTLKHDHPLSYEWFSSSVGKQGRLELKKRYQALLHKKAIGRLICCSFTGKNLLFNKKLGPDHAPAT
jgi:hypothetical protein